MKFSNDTQNEKSDAALQTHPHLGELRTLLLSMGGDMVCDWNEGNEQAFVFLIIYFGTLWPTKNLLRMPGEANRCHENAEKREARYPNRYRAITGYALNRDGMWRPHSWVFDSYLGRIADTASGESNFKYFGLPRLSQRDKLPDGMTVKM